MMEENCDASSISLRDARSLRCSSQRSSCLWETSPGRSRI